MTFGEIIKQYRKFMNLTQKELAEKSDIAVGTLQQYELNKRKPQLDIIKRIADVLEISVDFLLGYNQGSIPLDTKIEPLPDFEIAFRAYQKSLTDEEKEKLLSYMNFLISEREKNK